MHEDRDHRVEPDAFPVPAGQQAGADPGIILVVDHDAGPADLIKLSLPARGVLADPLAQLLVLVEELGASHFEARIGEDRPPRPVLALRAVVVLEQRSMGVVIAQEAAGHPLCSREFRRLVRKPDGLLSPGDGSSLARQRKELPAADQDQQARHRDEGDEPGPQTTGVASPRREIRPRHKRSPCRGPLGEVPGRHGAHDSRELMAVSCRLQAECAEGHEEEEPERTDPPVADRIDQASRGP